MLEFTIYRFVRLTNTFSISQLIAPKKFVGKSVRSLALYDVYKVYCIGLKENNELISINPEYVIQDKDRLVFSGAREDLETVAGL